MGRTEVADFQRLSRPLPTGPRAPRPSPLAPPPSSSRRPPNRPGAEFEPSTLGLEALHHTNCANTFIYCCPTDWTAEQRRGTHTSSNRMNPDART
jgi:hypothetical protein